MGARIGIFRVQNSLRWHKHTENMLSVLLLTQAWSGQVVRGLVAARPVVGRVGCTTMTEPHCTVVFLRHGQSQVRR